MSHTTAENPDPAEAVLIDLTATPLREILWAGETPLDRAAQAVVAGLSNEVYAAFGQAPRAQ